MFDESGLAKDCSSDTSKKSPGHQGDLLTGGISEKHKVLYCHNLDTTLDYEEVFLLMKKYGKVEKIKLTAVKERNCYDGYILFSSSESAVLAQKNLNGHTINNNRVMARLFSTDNINFCPTDFTPEEMNPNKPCANRERKLPPIIWYIAEYENGNNFMKATEWIKWKIGNIPDKYIKRYGKCILIEADCDTRACLLANFKPPVNGNIKSVTGHRTFNLVRGIVHSHDLYEFSEDEILERCPESIYKIQKLKGTNNSILMYFSTKFLPEFVSICNSRLKVKKYWPSPKQCRKCLDYGHVMTYCPNKYRCFDCSSEYEGEHTCSNRKYCFHCAGNHGPTSRLCTRFRFEQEIVTVAEDEHISLGSAKRRVLGANKDPNSTYASVVRQLKSVNDQSRENSGRNGSRNYVHERQRQQTQASTSKNQSSSDKAMEVTSSDDLPDLNLNPNPKEKGNKEKLMDLVGKQKDCHDKKHVKDLVQITGHKEHEGKNQQTGCNLTSKDTSNTKTSKENLDEFQFPKEKKRTRPVSPINTLTGVATKNSFSVLQKRPEKKKQAVSSKGNNSPSSLLSCRPKERIPSQDRRRAHSYKSMKNFEQNPLEDANLEQNKMNSSGTNKSEIDVDEIISHWTNPDGHEEPTTTKINIDKGLSNAKIKRLNSNFRSPTGRSIQVQSKNKMAGHSKSSK